ncbi:MAG: PepSY domain-containing protein [Xanthobacteraceae bacterium]|nr:PepSY domain-containing protein [Xanthobacteraceae bacterium]
MNRSLMWTLGGVFLVLVTIAAVVTAVPSRGPVFIAGDQPVTEDQVRQKLASDGWSNVQIVRDGRYFEAIASKDGQNNKIVVDSQTGRLRGTDDDDD